MGTRVVVLDDACPCLPTQGAHTLSFFHPPPHILAAFPRPIPTANDKPPPPGHGAGPHD